MNRIAELRKEKKLNQKELGSIVGVAQNTVCNWENGKREPDYDSLKRMADLFGVSVDYLLGHTGKKEMPPGDTMFPERLKHLRKERGLTQVQFAQAVNVANGTIAMWENGKCEPDYDTIFRIADYFHVSIDYLLGRTDKKEVPPPGPARDWMQWNSSS